MSADEQRICDEACGCFECPYTLPTQTAGLDESLPVTLLDEGADCD